MYENSSNWADLRLPHDVYISLVLDLDFPTYPLVLIQSTQDIVLLVFIFHNLPLL